MSVSLCVCVCLYLSAYVCVAQRHKTQSTKLRVCKWKSCAITQESNFLIQLQQLLSKCHKLSGGPGSGSRSDCGYDCGYGCGAAAAATVANNKKKQGRKSIAKQITAESLPFLDLNNHSS